MSEQYSSEDLANAIRELDSKIESEKKAHRTPPGFSGYSTMNSYQNSIVEWQLDLSKEFELIYHQLRGHVIKRDEDNNEFWAEPDDDEQKLLNEKGAQEIEKVVRNYLNKNVLLSNFDEKQIMQRVSQFAHRLRRFIYLNYEEFGLTTGYKQKHFEMLVMNIVDIVEAAYRRALGGMERESLTTIRQIIQSENIDNHNMSPPPIMSSNNQGGSKLNPLNWFKK